MLKSVSDSKAWVLTTQTPVNSFTSISIPCSKITKRRPYVSQMHINCLISRDLFHKYFLGTDYLPSYAAEESNQYPNKSHKKCFSFLHHRYSHS